MKNLDDLYTQRSDVDYSDIYGKADKMRETSKLSQDDTERILLAYTRASVANRNLSIQNQRRRSWLEMILDYLLGNDNQE